MEVSEDNLPGAHPWPLVGHRFLHLDDEIGVLPDVGGVGHDLRAIGGIVLIADAAALDRKSTRLNSSHANISYAVFCLKKKNNPICPDIRKQLEIRSSTGWDTFLPAVLQPARPNRRNTPRNRDR